eukprot:gnl/MRDRNA2_/MRDRNA2_147454_c0_seq1.p1 gnl/MRDRNA2_/MRDRNA2_147454_c0~~gnl/MRDRNA2_/MRDRNA2_147454_c0_seq1.p1  ORF type:complete len:432 (-),score=64.80 gnl/MRDRNA2_/MRDRNA2_147454_c0_seq1:186-1388(-)
MYIPLALFTWVTAQASNTDPAIYAQPPSTSLGCECSGGCMTNTLFECNAQPFCLVRSKRCVNGAANWSITYGSYYDWCTFKPYQTYESLTAVEKWDLLLKDIHQDTAHGDYPSTLGVLSGVMGESVMVSFDAQADVFPEPRKKYIHSVGTVAPISFKSSGDHKYTGLFTGADYGFIRLSSANCPSSSGFTPGAAVKLLRDGMPSANFVAMPSLDGQACKDNNFFEKNFTTHISATSNFGLKLIAQKFWQASYCPLMVGLSDVAATKDGSDSVFPFMLTLEPFQIVDFPCDDLTTALGNFATLEAGSTLFQVLATDAPGGSVQHIGDLVLTGQFTTSKFGDEQMFFKHIHMEKDFSIHPEWLAKIDRKQECGMGCTGTSAPDVSKGCTSPFHGEVTENLLI